MWQGTVRDLVGDPGGVVDELVGAAHAHLSVNPEEEKSWREGLPLVAKALEGQGLEDLGAALELMLPISLHRVDLVLAGKERRTGKKAILVVELKLWEKPLDDLHPSLQAKDYAHYLQEFHSFGREGVVHACAYLPKMDPSQGTSLKTSAPEDVPVFLKGEEEAFAHHIRCLLQPPGKEALESALNGIFSPSRSVVDEVEQILQGKEWALLGEQRRALEAIWKAVEEGKNLVAIVRGKPGTGKTVVAMHLLARALKHRKRAVYSIGSKSMNQVLRAKLREGGKLIKYNRDFHDPKNRKPPLDLLVVDEAHRLRETTGGYGSPTNIKQPEVEVLIESGQVVVFFLDDHQSVRSDEVGSTALIQKAAEKMGRSWRIFDLEAQFRCGGDTQYLEWVDWLLGYGPKPSTPPSSVRIRLVGSPEELEAGMRKALEEGKTARIVAGFCWPWSDPKHDGSLVPDVKIGGWAKPWNRKEPKKKRLPPKKHPYTIWATQAEGAEEVGCIYSAQGFEFDWVGVIWGEDLVYRGAWVAQPEKSFDPDAKRSKRDLPGLTKRLRNVYRVLLTRAREEVAILCLDEKTKEHLEGALKEIGAVEEGGNGLAIHRGSFAEDGVS